MPCSYTRCIHPLPILDVLQSFYQDIEINGLGRVEIKLIPKGSRRLFWCERLVERVLRALLLSRVHVTGLTLAKPTIESMTTHGKFRDATMAMAKDVLPDPELPATPMMLALPQGGS